MRKMACVALNAVYMAQPSTIAKPATWSVRSSSRRRTWRNLARSEAVTLRHYRCPDIAFRPRCAIPHVWIKTRLKSRRIPHVLLKTCAKRAGLGLLDARDLLQGGDPFLDL